MSNTIEVQPNQSILDVILQGCGTLEAGMEMMKINGRSISDLPAVGDTLLTDGGGLTELRDKAILQYFAENGIVIGTLGNTDTVAYRIILKPVMEVVPTLIAAPSVTGDYQFDFKAAAGFINVYPIQHNYFPYNDNALLYLAEDRYIAHELYFGNIIPGNYMDYKLLHYSITWTAGHGLMLAWMDLGLADKTATFVDEMGNRAYYSPLIVLGSDSQNVEDFLIADLNIEVVSVAGSLVTIRLTRFHGPIVHSSFTSYEMTWLDDSAGGTPDPMDAGNPDKTILVLSPGLYSFGVGTVYTNGPTVYPPSAITEIVEIG